MKTDYQLEGTGDDLYRALLEAHEGLSREESEALNARLILLMMNEIGDSKAIRAIFEAGKSK